MTTSQNIYDTLTSYLKIKSYDHMLVFKDIDGIVFK